MTNTMLATAIAFAAEKHKNQFDKAGMPYILHPLKVMHYLKTDDQELMAIAVLHDVVEDCFDTFFEGMVALHTLGLTVRITNAVAALTKIADQDDGIYLDRILSNPDAIKVKMADLRHNMDIRRLKGVTPKDIARLEKYAKMYNTLKAAL